MNAIFKKTRPAFFILSPLLTLTWIGVCVLALIRQGDFGVTDIIACIGGAFFICIGCIIPALYNRNAYLQIHDNKIRGKFGLFKRFECEISEVEFVLAQMGTVQIILKDRKYYIGGIQNAYNIGAFIMARIPFSPSDHWEEQIADIKRHKQYGKRNTVFTLCAIVLSFVWVFITVLLTGARDLPEFNRTDWIIFSVMCFFEVITVVAMFVFAVKTRHGHPVTLEPKVYQIRRSVIEATPLPESAGQIYKVFTDAYFTQRITVYHDGTRNCSNSFYYTAEMFDDDFRLKIAYVSDDFEIEEIDEMLDGRMDIMDMTEKFFEHT